MTSKIDTGFNQKNVLNKLYFKKYAKNINESGGKKSR